MVRAAFCDQHGTRKGAWSKEEDDKLRSYVETYGHFNWRKLPKSAGLARCGKSCRLRWMNYLRPDLKRGNFTQKEEETIIKLHEQHGNKWSLIAEKLPGRTDNGIKNYWHSHIKKRLKRNEMKSEFKVDTSEGETVHFTESENLRCAVSYSILESSLPMSPETSNLKDISFHNSNHAQIQSTMNLSREESPNSGLTFEEFSSTFWTEPFMVENTYNQAYNPISIHGEDSQPYFSFSYDDDTELLYQVMQDQFPNN